MKAIARFLCVLSLTAFCSACSGGGDSAASSPPPPPPPPPPLSLGPDVCIDGNAGDFPCAGVTLRKRVPIEAMDGTGGNDIWGWFDAQMGNEYALMGMENGTAFVDISNPEDPVFLGRLPTKTGESVWRDIKVYKDHAYIVADNVGAHGMQVFVPTA